MIYTFITIVVAFIASIAGAAFYCWLYLPDMKKELSSELDAHFNEALSYHKRYLIEEYNVLKASLDGANNDLHAEVSRQTNTIHGALRKDIHARVDAVLADVEPRVLEALKAQFKEAIEKAVSDMGDDVAEADKTRFLNSFHW